MEVIHTYSISMKQVDCIAQHASIFQEKGGNGAVHAARNSDGHLSDHDEENVSLAGAIRFAG